MAKKVKFTGAFRYGNYIRVIAIQGKKKAIQVFSYEKIGLLGLDSRTESLITDSSSMRKVIRFKPILAEDIFKCEVKMEGYLCDVATREIFYKLSKK